MPFARPSFADLISSAQADLARLPGAAPSLRRSFTYVLSYQSAALASGEYDYLDWMVANVLLPDTATGGYLDRWANIKGLARLAAAPAAGNAVLSGNVNAAIPAGTQLQNADGSAVYATQAAASIGDNSSVTVPILAIAGGSAGNQAASAPLTIMVGIAGVLANAMVDGSGLSGGTDTESDAGLRVRVLFNLQQPPQGGAAKDYVAWAENGYAGVTRVWVYPLQGGLGTVSVIFVMDGRANNIPLPADVAAVQAAVQALAPVTAVVTVRAPTAQPVPIIVKNLILAAGYSAVTVQANIQSALISLFATMTPGGYGYDGQAQAYRTGGTLFVEAISAAINAAPGVASFDVAAPLVDVVIGFGVMPTFGGATYQ